MPNVLANPVAGFGLDALSVPDAGDPIGINFTTEEVRLVTNVGDSVPTDFAFGSESPSTIRQQSTTVEPAKTPETKQDAAFDRLDGVMTADQLFTDLLGNPAKQQPVRHVSDSTEAALGHSIQVVSAAAMDKGLTGTPLSFSTSAPPLRQPSAEPDLRQLASLIAPQSPRGSAAASDRPVDPTTANLRVPGMPQINHSTLAALRGQTVAELDPPNPPNNPPVTQNDTATTNEDTPVTISVLSNDSDPDGDALHTWLPDASTPNGKVAYSGDQVVYTPDPGFFGTDTFTYSAVDSAGATADATVTVTVNFVNHAPVANNDAFSFNLTAGTYGPFSVAAPGVLANDIDYDTGVWPPQGMTPVLDTPPDQGVNWFIFNSDGSFDFARPFGFYGVVTFTYHVVDSVGAASNIATVKIIIAPPIPQNPPAFQAVNDAYPVGQNPTSVSAAQGVLANDVGSYIAVLKTPPSQVGKITSFNFDGSFSFAPSYSFYSQVPTTLTYTLFSADGRSQDATITEYAVWLYISGGSDSFVELKSQLDPGAFTVANLNDTNGDGTVDKDQQTVKKLATNPPAGSSDEIDLMRLSVFVGDPNPGQNTVTVTFTGPTVAIWTKSTKEGLIPLDNGVATFSVLALKTNPVMYVEATKKSSAVGDIVITEQYLNKTYTVKATAIWAEKTGFRNTGNSLSADVDSKTMQDSFKNDWGSRLGLVGAETGAPMTRNAMEMEFTVSPSGMNEQPGVRFDISRSVEWKNWSTTAGTRTLQNSIPFNAFKDNPNDDDFSTDESNIPKNDHIYVIDGPGWRNNIANSARLELRFNFVEFVRVKINGSKFANTNGTDAAPNVEGSRASPLTQWYARLDLIDDGTGKWKRNNTPGENEINTGSKALGN